MTPYIEIKGLFVLFQFTRARFPRSRFSCKSFVKCSMCWYKLERAGSVSEISVFGGMCHMNTSVRSPSLRSKPFRLVSEQRKTEERDSRFWPREKWNKSQKMKVGGGGGEGRKRLQTNPLVSRSMLTCVDQRFVSYWEDGMVRDTNIKFQWLLFILVRKICPPMQEHFLWPLLKRKALLATK